MENIKYEHIVADNVTEATWLRLKRLSSIQLCKQIISKNTKTLSQDIINDKAEGMASAIRSALDYWETKGGGLNSRLVSRYYALLQISIAEQIALDKDNTNLKNVQKHSEQGHGLFTLKDPQKEFPSDTFLGCLKNGHFYQYLKNIGNGKTILNHSNDKRPKKYEEGENLISIVDLLRRVPELANFIKEYIGEDQLSFQVVSSIKNTTVKNEKILNNLNKTGKLEFNPTEPEDHNKTTYISILLSNIGNTSIETLSTLFPEIKDLEEEVEIQEQDVKSYVGKLYHPKNSYWYNYIDTYKSGYCGTSIIAPFWGINDPFVLHLCILYCFSIIARYLPETWHEIEYGKYDYVRELLEHYIVIVDNVIPKIAIERLTKTKLNISTAGGFNAPV